MPSSVSTSYSIFCILYFVFCILYFVFHSIKARELLSHQWESALNPASEAKKALVRLKALERDGVEGQQRDAQLTLLAHSSVCWNR